MSCCEGAARGGILLSILNRVPLTPARHTCSCARRTLLAVRAPHSAFRAVSRVLAKTFRFVKNVPCFRGLPAEDQLRLVLHSWAPLLVLGMVQDAVDFDTVEITQQPSLLHGILTHREETRDPGVLLRDVEGIQLFLLRCRGLNISVKEYAFLKGAVLFTPDAGDLECRDYVDALRREAERALHEHARTAQRFVRLRALLRTLRRVDADALAALFFRPVTGTSGIDEHVLAMFYARHGERE